VLADLVQSVSWVIAGAAGVLVLLWWWNRRERTPTRAVLIRTLRRKLRRITNDDAVVERLVAKERERHPDHSEEAVLERVLRRLTRDRRR
jgi:hypothetical protein